MNYAFDLQWRYEWERRQLTGNSLRLASGSVEADSLLTDLDININHELNEKWRFQGRFNRLALRQRSGGDDQLLLGLERFIFNSSSLYFMVNPQYEKEFMDVAAGYTFYKDNREQYVRLGVFLEDYPYDRKNNAGGKSQHDQIALQWLMRLELGNEWYLYSEGEVGNGFDRVFEEPANSPETARFKRRENSAELRVSKFTDDGTGWSVWTDWYDLDEAKEFRDQDLFYDYQTTQFSVSAEHIRVIGDRHRWRFLLHYADFQAERVGHYAHEFDRADVLGGVYYEYLLPNSGLTLAYVAGVPEAEFRIDDPDDGINIESYGDKIIGGWRYTFSGDAQLRIFFSHELANGGFAGSSVQYQMFF